MSIKTFVLGPQILGTIKPDIMSPISNLVTDQTQLRIIASLSFRVNQSAGIPQLD